MKHLVQILFSVIGMAASTLAVVMALYAKDRAATIISDKEWAAISAVPGDLTREEAEWLAGKAGLYRSWTICGVGDGRTMLALGLHLPSKGLLQVADVKFSATFYATVKTLVKARPDLRDRILARYGTPAEAATRLMTTRIAFLDGSQYHELTQTDIDAWRPKPTVGKCECIMGHDYDSFHPGVVAAVDALLPSAAKPVGSIWASQPYPQED